MIWTIAGGIILGLLGWALLVRYWPELLLGAIAILALGALLFVGTLAISTYGTDWTFSGFFYSVGTTLVLFGAGFLLVWPFIRWHRRVEAKREKRNGAP